MAIDISGAVSPYEERERQKKAAQKKRLIVLFIACVAVGIARFVVKDPPPPRAADHTGKYVALPGVLDKMSPQQKAKLNPEILAQLKEADQKALVKKIPTFEEELLARGGGYKPADAPPENLRDKELEEEFRYQYVRRQQIVASKREEEVVDHDKSTLVRFKNGRYVKVRRTRDVDSYLAMELDRTIVASVPKKTILSVTPDALTWQEPVAKGSVRLKPAKGIIITVNKNVAERITIVAPIRNES